MRSPEELALVASIADDLPAGVWVATAPDGRFAYANRAFEEIMGMAPLEGLRVGEYAEPYGIFTRDGRLYPEDRMPFVRALEARSTVVVDDIVIHRRDSRKVFIRASARPRFDAAGAITHVVVAFVDITREVEAEEERARAHLREAEARERLSRVVENAPIVFFCFDTNGLILLCQGQGLRRLGWDPLGLVGRNVFQVFKDLPAVIDHARRALSGETTTQRIEIRNGTSWGFFDTWLTPLYDEFGKPSGVLGVSTDVTEQERMEVQLERAERLASVGMLAAGVAHEINNPLSYVVANLDLVVGELAKIEDAALQRSLEEKILDARHGAERVSTIVKDLRVFSGSERSKSGTADVQKALDGAVKIASNEIRHRARFGLDVADVPRVRVDEGRLAQLFLNLLVNAAHAIPEGAADRNEIRVSIAKDGPTGVRIEVRDSGVGIPADVLPKIFDPFFTTKAVGVGTGLGLSISHGIVTAAGGRIEVESAPGSGSTFRVILPVSSEPRSTDVEQGKVVPPARHRARVLVVDDEALILKVVTQVLEGEFEVSCETKAEAALARIRAGERFDVILCDLMMPHLDGMDLHAALLDIAPEQAKRTVFLTGGAFTPRARQFLERSPHATVQKPFNAATLVNRVRVLLTESPG